MKSLRLVSGLCWVAAVACQPPPTGSEEAPLVEPRGLYIQVPYEHLRASGVVPTLVGRRGHDRLFIGAGDPPLPIYANRFGGTYSPGPDDSRQNTSIIPNQTSQVDGYGGSAGQWQEIIACLQEQFAPFNAVIVEQEPASGPYIESVIGGYPQQVGLGGGVGGVAPIDTFNCGVIGNAIVFTFSAVFGEDARTSCEVAAQEIAHAISLDHELYCPDPMTYLSGCGEKIYQNYDADCGEFSRRQCECGRPTQNSVEVLTDKLGPNSGLPPPPPVNDPVPPEINITSPANGATLQQDSTITVTAVATDDQQIASTELFWQFSNNTFPCPGQSGGGAVTCTRSGNTSTWNIRVGQGARTFYARARDIGGNVAQTPSFTIQLGTAVPPPNDATPPSVSLVGPLNNAVLPANSTIQVEANVSDDMGLASVDLDWIFSQDSFPCPFQGQDVSCTENAGQYIWSIRVGVGTRRFKVRATDLAGNVTETPEIDITLETEAPPPDPNADTVGEDNDNPSQAFPLRCGTAIDLVVASGDDDWFSYEAPRGTAVELGVVAAAGTVIGIELYDAAGAQQLNSSADILAGGGTISGTSLGPVLLARVTTAETAAPYRLTATCMAGDPNNPPNPMDPNNPLDPKPEDPAATDGPQRLAELSGGCGCRTSNSGDLWEAVLLLGAIFVFISSRRRSGTW
jgi:hypothetical protein